MLGQFDVAGVITEEKASVEKDASIRSGCTQASRSFFKLVIEEEGPRHLWWGHS